MESGNEKQESGMKEIVLERDGERDLRFVGREIGSGTTYEHSGPSNNRWTEIRIYATKGGKYVTEIVGMTLWQGEHSRRSACACADEAAVVDALTQTEGDGQYLSGPAKDALHAAGIDFAEDVE